MAGNRIEEEANNKRLTIARSSIPSRSTVSGEGGYGVRHGRLILKAQKQTNKDRCIASASNLSEIEFMSFTSKNENRSMIDPQVHVRIKPYLLRLRHTQDDTTGQEQFRLYQGFYHMVRNFLSEEKVGESRIIGRTLGVSSSHLGPNWNSLNT